MSSSVRCRRPALRVGGLLLAVALAGCGESRPAAYPVQGQVLTKDGKPAAGAQVIFHPLGDVPRGAMRPIATVDDVGAFAMTTYNKGDGVPAGEYAVTIEWLPPHNRFTPPGEDKLKGKYAKADKTPFKVTVGKQPTTLEPFQVE